MKKFHGHLAHLIHKLMGGKWELSRCLDLARLCDPYDVRPLIEDLKEELRNPQPDYDDMYSPEMKPGVDQKFHSGVSVFELI